LVPLSTDELIAVRIKNLNFCFPKHKAEPISYDVVDNNKYCAFLLMQTKYDLFKVKSTKVPQVPIKNMVREKNCTKIVKW